VCGGAGDERGGCRRPPLADALAHGGSWEPGTCSEIGSGTGLLTPLLERVWDAIVCVDLAREMLAGRGCQG
jgi:trans-aconitate methyltransferase